jgi:hypothetical protein
MSKYKGNLVFLLITSSLIASAALGALGLSLSLEIGELVTELTEVPTQTQTTPQPYRIGNIEITEHDMNAAGWEGQLWEDARGKALGVAVRRIRPEDCCDYTFTGNDDTEWGQCHSWSAHSNGNYCLIRRDDLTDKGRTIYFMFANPYVYDTLP